MRRVGLAFPRGRRRGRERRCDELRHLAHQALLVPADAVPLEQRELGLVPAAELVVAKHAAELVDVAAARREQALHRELGRRLKILRRRPQAARARDDALDRGVRHAGARQRRRLDLEHAARGEERADGAEHCGALPQRVERCAAFVGHARQPGVKVPSACPMRTASPSVTPGAKRTARAPNSTTTVEPMLKRPISAPRPTGRGGCSSQCSRSAARDLAVRERADARDVQRADEHDGHRAAVRLEPADDALVAAEEARDRRGRCAAHAETRARNVARAHETRVERRVHAVIVVRREIDREIGAALERLDRGARFTEQLRERVDAALRLIQAAAVDGAVLRQDSVRRGDDRVRRRSRSVGRRP